MMETQCHFTYNNGLFNGLFLKWYCVNNESFIYLFIFLNESFKIYFHKVHILSTVILKTFKMSTLFLNMYQ